MRLIEFTGHNKESVVDTPQFKSWFRGSKVVDVDGNPLLVYHGTYESFDEFKKGDLGFHVGTKNQATNRKRAKPKVHTSFAKWNTMALYASIKNPLRTSDAMWHSSLDTWDAVSDSLYGDTTVMPAKIQNIGKPKIKDKEKLEKLRIEAIKQFLISKGYDGIVYSNEWESVRKKSDSWIAFYPNQIKSATRNDGSFSNNNNIYK